MEFEKYIEEKEIKDNNSSIPIEELDILIQKAKKNICKIYCSDKSTRTGFFCNIRYDYNTIITVLMTNYHALKEKEKKRRKK